MFKLHFVSLALFRDISQYGSEHLWYWHAIKQPYQELIETKVSVASAADEMTLIK